VVDSGARPEAAGGTWRGEEHQSRLQKLARLARGLVSDPVVVVRAMPGEFRQRYGSEQYGQAEVDEAWEEKLHRLLGAPWPCPQAQELDNVMADVRARLAAAGIGIGRDSYGWYADADSLVGRCVWCTVVHLRPEVVIETGVAHGITSRIVLEALAQNDRGHLWSIDLPFPFDRRLHVETGLAVTDACRSRWSYLEGASRQRLPRLVGEVGHIEMFIHDSLHTARNTAFEMEQAARGMQAGGVMVVDDIKMHRGFAVFAARHPEWRTIVCRHADEIGMFGIAIKAVAG
jgi:hypothetical protein